VVSLAFYGHYTAKTLLMILLMLPVTLIGAQLGIFVYRRLDDSQFRRLLIGLLFASGVLLFLRELPALL
jgi:uncharacterized membrane protein YfcA